MRTAIALCACSVLLISGPGHAQTEEPEATSTSAGSTSETRPLNTSVGDDSAKSDPPAQTGAEKAKKTDCKKSGDGASEESATGQKCAVAIRGMTPGTETVAPSETAQSPAVTSVENTTAQDADEESVDRDETEFDSVFIVGNAEAFERVTGSAHRVGKKELENQEYDDVHRVLKQVPGVYVRDEDGHGLRPNIGLRGANSDRSAKVTLMEDGVLMAPAPYSAPAAYYFPLTTRLTGVEVFKGPASIQYGPNTIGGALNLVTRAIPARGDAGAIDLSLGGYGGRKVHAYYGHGANHYGVLFEFAQIGSDGFKELDDGGETGYDKADYMVKFRLNNDLAAEVHHRLELKLGYATELSHETYLGLSDEDFKKTPYRRYAASQLGDMSWSRVQAKLSYDLAIGEHIEFNLTGYRHEFERDWIKLNGFGEGAITGSGARVTIEDVLRAPSRFDSYYRLLNGTHEWTGDAAERLAIGNNARTVVSQGGQARGEWRYEGDWFGNVLEAGVRYHMDEIQRHHTQAEYDMVAGTTVRATDVETIRRNTGRAHAVSAHVLNELQFGDGLRLSPGLRVESIHTELTDRGGNGGLVENDALVFVPGVGAWVSLGEHWGLLGGVHQGFSPLAPGSNAQAKPEKSTNYEVGTRWQYSKVRGELIGFFNDYNNLVGTCTQSAGCAEEDIDEQFNAGRAHILGAEAVIGTATGLGFGYALNVDLTYTWTKARFKSDFDSSFSQWGSVKEGDILPYVPEHQASVRVGVQGKTTGVTVTTTHVGEMRDVAGQGEADAAELVESNTVVDLAAFYRPTPKGRLYLTIDNLLAQDYMVSRRPFGARPGKRFQLNLGYQHTF